MGQPLPPTTVRAPLLSKVLCSAHSGIQMMVRDGPGSPLWHPDHTGTPCWCPASEIHDILAPLDQHLALSYFHPSSAILTEHINVHSHPQFFSASSTPIKLHPISTLAVSLHNWCIFLWNLKAHYNTADPIFPSFRDSHFLTSHSPFFFDFTQKCPFPTVH